jgi:hypothetical protein
MSSAAPIRTLALASSDRLKLPEVHWHSRWYAVYTRANHERRVSEQLGLREVEHFLPLYSSIRKWKDRTTRLDMRLFPGYIFVHMPLRDRLQILRLTGVACLVGFDRTPAALPADEIETLRASLTSELARWTARGSQGKLDPPEKRSEVRGFRGFDPTVCVTRGRRGRSGSCTMNYSESWKTQRFRHQLKGPTGSSFDAHIQE